MKKIFIVLFVITALAISVSGYGFDLNVKKKACETACDKTYNDCMKKSQDEYDKGKDSGKKKASDLACTQAKDTCYKKCSQ